MKNLSDGTAKGEAEGKVCRKFSLLYVHQLYLYVPAVTMKEASLLLDIREM